MLLHAHNVKLNIPRTLLLLSLCLCLCFCACGKIGWRESDTTAAADLPVIVDAADTAYSYTDMEEDLIALAETYPHLLTVKSAGQSHDGRELYYALFGTEDAAATIMIQAGIHGREYLTPLLVMCQLEYYLSHYEQESENGMPYSKLLRLFRFCVVPMINPDGIMLSEEGLSSLRSETLRRTVETIYLKDVRTSPDLNVYFGDINGYLRLWKANATGVDLNRNFGIEEWDAIKSRSYPSLQSFKGEAPNSEPETRALMELTESFDDLLCTISYHSQGEILYWDSGQTGSVRDASVMLTDLVAELTGYAVQDSFTAADGTYNDWSMLNLGIPSLIIETGLGECPLPHEQFAAIWEKNYLLWDRLADFFLVEET